MKKLLLILTVIVLFGACEEEPELGWDDIEHIYYNGDVDLSFPGDVSRFETLMEMGYNAIDGNLTMRGHYGESSIDFLAQLYVVTGSVFISEMKYPKDIFDNLIEVGGSIYLSDMYEFDDFNKLESVQGINIVKCYFISIEGFNNLDSCDYLILKDHFGQVNQFNAFPSLMKTNLLHLNLNQLKNSEYTGLKELRSCKHLILENAGMNTLPQLEVIEDRLDISGSIGANSLGSCPGSDTLTFFDTDELNANIFANQYAAKILNIENCQHIEDMNWTSRIDSVVKLRIIDCNDLYSLGGLEKQDLLDTLTCSMNDKLIDYCSLSDLDISSSHISFNAYNPNWSEIVNGLCLKPGED